MTFCMDISCIPKVRTTDRYIFSYSMRTRSAAEYASDAQ